MRGKSASAPLASRRIFSGSAPKKIPPESRASAVGFSAATTTAFRREIFCARKKYSSRTGSRVLYFSPVESCRRRVVPCSMFCETESEFQIAAQTRAASSGAFRRAPQPRPRISLVTHHLLAQRRPAASQGSLITPAPRILIVTPRLEFPANTTKQTSTPIPNRYKMPFFHLDAPGTHHFAAIPSSLQPLIPRPQNLIANLELESRLTPLRINKLQFSNRKFFAISSALNRAAYRKSQATKVLIENARLNSDLTGKDSNRLQISNRERIEVSCSAALSQSRRYQSHLPISKSPIPSLQPARRIRDTCTDIPSLRAFPRCYASCASRRKSE
jgi:hypothetical protein